MSNLGPEGVRLVCSVDISFGWEDSKGSLTLSLCCNMDLDFLTPKLVGESADVVICGIRVPIM